MAMVELLKRFVAGRDDIREYMRAPFVQGEWIYATNGHIAVRVPKTEGIEAEESAKPAKIGDLFEKNKRDTFIEIPALPPREKCPTCNGSGIGYRCSECNGEGEIEHSRHTYGCKECGGSGQTDDGDDADKEPCVDCDGDGESRYKAVAVGNWHYDRRYLAKILELPAVKFAQRHEGMADLEDAAIAYFVFDGGEGILMPMRA